MKVNNLNLKAIFDAAYLPVILLVAILIRFWGISDLSLRLDETQSIWQATHSIEFIKNYMLKNVHLPLHNSLLHVWMRYFGTDPASVRLLAMIPGVLSVPVIYLLSSEILGKDRSRLTIFLAAFSPIFIWYSREIRMYTLLVLITSLSYLFFIRFLKRNRWYDHVGYTIVNIIGAYTHYFFFFVLMVQVVFFFSVMRGMNKSGEYKVVPIYLRLLYLFLSAEVLALAYYPWVSAVLQNYGSGTYAPVFGEPIPFNLLLSYFEYISGFLPPQMTAVAISGWPIVIVLGFVFFTKRQNPFSHKLGLVILGASLPIIFGYTFSVLVRPIYLTRYFITVTPMLYIALAWYLSELKGKVRNIFIVAFVAWVLVCLYVQNTHPDNPSRENYSEAVAYIEENASPRDLVFLSPAYTIYPFQYYYSGSAKVLTLPIWDKRKGQIPEATEERVRSDISSVREGHRKFFLLVTTNLAGSEPPKQYLDNNFTKLDKQQFSKDIWVHVYQAEYLD